MTRPKTTTLELPRQFTLLYRAGLLMAGLGTLMAIGAALHQDPSLWDQPANRCQDALLADPTTSRQTPIVYASPRPGRGRLQREFRCNEIERLYDQVNLARHRSGVFRTALADEDRQSFENARLLIADEEQQIRELERRLESLQIDPISESLPGLLLIVTIGAIVPWLATRLLLRHAARVEPFRVAENSFSEWRQTYSWIVLVIFAAPFLRESYTSVLMIEKTWYAWSSFYISPPAWCFLRVTNLGLAVMIAAPLCAGRCLSRIRLQPKALDARSTDGRWGVGGYVLFLQTWAISLFVFTLAPFLAWLSLVRAEGPRFSAVYAADWLGLLIVALWLASHLVWAATRLRLMYQRQRAALGETWASISATKPPPDPTVDFLGKTWWSLPATVLGAAAVLSQATSLLFDAAQVLLP